MFDCCFFLLKISETNKNNFTLERSTLEEFHRWQHLEDLLYDCCLMKYDDENLLYLCFTVGESRKSWYVMSQKKKNLEICFDDA
jgi:hypothetical protein